MTGLQFSDLATQSRIWHSLLFSITLQKQLETASNDMNSLFLTSYVHVYINIHRQTYISSYLKPFRSPFNSQLWKTNTTSTSSVPSLQSETSLTASIPHISLGKITSGSHQSRRNTAKLSTPFRRAHVKKWCLTTSDSCRTIWAG